MKNFAANYAAHVSEKLQPLAGNMPIRQSVIDLVLLPCNVSSVKAKLHTILTLTRPRIASGLKPWRRILLP